MKSSISYGEPVNGQRPKVTTIGYVETTETIERRISYETASWYTLVDVPAGRYPVVVHEHFGSKWILVKFEGVITKEHFVNRVFTASSVSEPTERIGKTAGCSAQMYDYIAAERFATDPEWTLADDWKVEIEERSYDGRPRAAFRLVGPEA